jgi:hypothetical protein
MFDRQKVRLRLQRLMRSKSLRNVAAFLVVGICTVALSISAVGISGSVLRSDVAGKRDFVAYWSSGQLLLHHQNPYDGSAVLALERSTGYANHRPLFMRNPPSALLLVLPLGYVRAWPGVLFWSLLLIACLMASVQMVRAMHGSPKNRLHLLGYSFGPALVCIVAGQMGLLVLLGLACFLRWHRSRPLLAGASLWFCMLKPHLFLPFGVALLAWAIFTHSYKVFAGVALALCVSSAVAMSLDPAVWMHYRQMLVSDHVDRTAMQCLSTAVRRSIDPGALWLQYLPASLASVWALAFFRKHRGHWDWLEHGSPLMLVSALVAPYIWITDQAVLLPAVLHGVYLCRSRRLLAGLALGSAFIEYGMMGGVQPFHSAFYLWTAPAWLAWYLGAVQSSRLPNSAPIMAEAPSRANEACP